MQLMLEGMGKSHKEAFDHVGSEEMMLNIMTNDDKGKIRMDLHFFGLARAMGKSTVSLLKAKDIDYQFAALENMEDQKGLLEAEDTDDFAALETKEDQTEYYAALKEASKNTSLAWSMVMDEKLSYADRWGMEMDLSRIYTEMYHNGSLSYEEWK